MYVRKNVLGHVLSLSWYSANIFFMWAVSFYCCLHRLKCNYWPCRVLYYLSKLWSCWCPAYEILEVISVLFLLFFCASFWQKLKAVLGFCVHVPVSSWCSHLNFNLYVWQFFGYELSLSMQLLCVVSFPCV